MESPDTFLGQLADAARSMQEKRSTQETLDEAVLVAIESIEGCDLAGMSIVNRHGVDTPAGSGATLRRLDTLQFELKEGPCFDAVQNHEVVLARDLANEARWPNWGPRVAEEIGVRSIVSYRLFTAADTLGAMNLTPSGPTRSTPRTSTMEEHSPRTLRWHWRRRRTSRTWRLRSTPAPSSVEPRAS